MTRKNQTGHLSALTLVKVSSSSECVDLFCFCRMGSVRPKQYFAIGKNTYNVWSSIVCNMGLVIDLDCHITGLNVGRHQFKQPRLRAEPMLTLATCSLVPEENDSDVNLCTLLRYLNLFREFKVACSDRLVISCTPHRDGALTRTETLYTIRAC